MTASEMLALLDGVAADELAGWVARGWVRADEGEAGFEFLEIDLARARLVRDLRRRIEVPEPAIGLVLSLLDQVYALRAQLRAALDQTPPRG
jgi:chaperone modulatory protein CbpM